LQGDPEVGKEHGPVGVVARGGGDRLLNRDVTLRRTLVRVLARTRERPIAQVVMAHLITCERRANKPRACEAVEVAVAWAAT
jgi:hypothetical protein